MYFGLKYQVVDGAAIGITIAYVLALVLFTINIFIAVLPIFRHRGAQINTILSKVFIPLFMAIDSKAHYIFFILAVLFTLVDLLITRHNKYNNQTNRLFYYKLLGLVAMLILTINYLIEVEMNN